MTPKRSKDGGVPAEITAFLDRLDHPLKPALEVVLAAIRAAAPGTAESIKWNAPSFFVRASGQFFATVNVYARPEMPACVLLVLHQDAKPTKGSRSRVAIDDPERLLEWAANDRCTARFADEKDARAKSQALRAIVTQWVAAL